MELALSLGMTVGELEQRMSTTELGLWARWSHERGLPWRRIELHLAKIAHGLGIGFGYASKDATFVDYLIDPAPPLAWCPWPRPEGYVDPDADTDDPDDPDAGDPFGYLPIEG